MDPDFLRCFLKVSADDYNQNTNKVVLKSRIGHSVFFVTAIQDKIRLILTSVTLPGNSLK